MGTSEVQCSRLVVCRGEVGVVRGDALVMAPVLPPTSVLYALSNANYLVPRFDGMEEG